MNPVPGGGTAKFSTLYCRGEGLSRENRANLAYHLGCESGRSLPKVNEVFLIQANGTSASCCLGTLQKLSQTHPGHGHSEARMRL